MRRVVLAALGCAALAMPCCCAVLSSAQAAEPAGQPSAALFREGFDDPNLLQRGWYDGDRFTISAKEPFAGKGCLEYHWKAGATSPDSSSGIRHLFAPSDVVYVRYCLKLSQGWGWSGRSYHPHLTHFLTTENDKFRGPANSHLTLYIEPCNGQLRLGATDMQNAEAPHGLTQGPLLGGYNGRLYDSQAVLFRDDRWHCVEALFRLNTLDAKADKPNPDGVIQGWFDGALVVDRSDVILRSPDFPKMQFNQFLLTPYFGPGLLPHEQTLWIDELVVGTKRLGPIDGRSRSSAPPGPAKAQGR
jgi:hypothetical protein